MHNVSEYAREIMREIMREMERRGFTRGEAKLLPKMLLEQIEDNNRRIEEYKPFTVFKLPFPVFTTTDD